MTPELMDALLAPSTPEQMRQMLAVLTKAIYMAQEVLPKTKENEMALAYLQCAGLISLHTKVKDKMSLEELYKQIYKQAGGGQIPRTFS